jgi:hypothetical protein
VARRQLKLVGAVVLFLSLSFSGPAIAAPSQTSVLADLQVNEPVEGDVVVFGANLELGPEARVSGDAIVIGGNIRLSPGAEVGRHVVAVIGQSVVPAGALVEGRVLAFSSVATLAPAGLADRSLHLNLALRLLTSGGWLLMTTGLAFLLPVRVRYGTWAMPVLGIKVPALGAMVWLTWFAALIAVLGLGPALGPPLVAALWVLFFVAKAAGLTVLGGWVGAAVLRRWVHHPVPITLEVFVGVLALLALRFLPVVGGTFWVLVSVTALGACVAVLVLTNDGAAVEASQT